MATVAQRVNEMRFALRSMGVPSEVTDHLDLKAHADPLLTARENISNLLETHGLERSKTVRDIASMEEEHRDNIIDAEVEQRLAEREAELVAEIRAEGCAECNHKLRELEKRLRATARGQALKKRPAVRRSMASAAQKAAQARFKAAAKQAKSEGKKGKAYSERVGQILRGAGGRAKKAAKKAGSKAKAGAKSAGSKVSHKTRGLLQSVSPGMLWDSYPAAKGLYRVAERAWIDYRDSKNLVFAVTGWKDGHFDRPKAWHAVENIGGGAIGSYAAHQYRTKLLSPMAKRVMNLRPFQAGGLDLGTVNVRGLIEGGISLAGAAASGKMYLANEKFYDSQAGAIGIVGIGPGKTPGVDRHAVAVIVAPAAGQYAGWKAVDIVTKSALTPAPLKRVFTLGVMG